MLGEEGATERGRIDWEAVKENGYGSIRDENEGALSAGGIAGLLVLLGNHFVAVVA